MLSDKLKVLFLVNLAPKLDEGQKNVSRHLLDHLDAEVNKLLIDSRCHNLRDLKKSFLFRPHIIHVFLRVNIKTLLLVIIFGKIIGGKILFSIFQPPKRVHKALWFFTRKNYAFTLSKTMAASITNRFKSTFSVYPGVDLRKFRPVTHQEKIRLRNKYGLSEKDFIVLHVGHLLPGRNLEVIARAALITKTRLIVVVSPLFAKNQTVERRLKAANIKIISEYLQNIEEIYQLSDLYLFPTVNPGSVIDIPLSVLEALACGIPVVTTPIGGLPELLKNNVIYARNTQEFIEAVSIIKMKRPKGNPSKIVADLSWDKTARQVKEIYFKILRG